MSVIDDYSRIVCIFILKIKDEAFLRFKEWQNIQENQTNKKIKTFRTDNGLEFCNQEFDLHCSSHCIMRYKIVKATPQQNGVAERLLDK